jgi:peptide/nickel transport system substrate-binding protein
MKKVLLVILAIIVLSGLVFIGCGKEETTTTTAPSPTKTTAPAPTSTTVPTSVPTSTVKPTTTTPAAGQPVRGGTFRIIGATGLVDLGYPPKMNPTDEATAKYYTEALVSWNLNGDFMPELAESWDLDQANKRITFHLRKGVKFHDGTDFNAEAVRYIAQLRIDTKRMVDAKYIDSLQVIDDYTFRYNLNTWINPAKALHSWAYGVTIYSPTALKEKGEEWNTTNFVSTGPFKFAGFERDVFLKLVRNENYWRGPQYPYLDAIEIKMFADVTTMNAAMQAGEGDAWGAVPTKEALDLQAMGLKLATQPGMYFEIVPDNKTPGSVWADKKVREALEYAMDKQGLAQGLGYGTWIPMKMLAPEGSFGYNPDFPERKYDPAKAKQLLADAGYPNGFKTKMMVFQGNLDLPQAIQKYAADVGIEIELVVADPGRFFGALFGAGWGGGLLQWMVPVDPEFAIGWLVHFGKEPIIFYSSLQWPDKYWELNDKFYFAPTIAEGRQATKDMITYASEEAQLIPLCQPVTMYIVQPYVHSTYLSYHFMTLNAWEWWMEKKK